MAEVHEIEKFFGCYLLCSMNEKFKGRTYIGFTVNPNRRIKQHNAGYAKGGAKRTSGKGPWDMVLIIHGFPNEIAALRFEWAWQNPEKSLRLKHLVPRTKHYNFIFKFNVVSEMLRIGPWCRLPLTIRWLKQEYARDFSITKQPPAHMPIVYGPVTIVDSKGTKKSETVASSQLSQRQPSFSQTNSTKMCFICKEDFLLNNSLKCIKCQTESHTICLAKHFVKSDAGNVLPIEGNCLKCGQLFLWGDLVRYKLGCYKDLDVNLDDLDAEEEIIDSDQD